MRYSARSLLTLALTAALAACGDSGGSPAYKGRPAGPSLGSPDPLFGLTGAVVRNASWFVDGPVAMAADAESVYVVGNSGYDQLDRFGQIEKRSLATGALVPGFGTNGIVTVNPGPGFDECCAIAADADHLYLLGTDGALGGSDTRWRLEKRFKSTGLLDADFGNMGVILINPTAGWDQPSHLLVDGDSLYLAGTEWAGTSARIEKRGARNGAPDPVFMNPWTFDLVPGTERVAALRMDPSGLYAAVVPDGTEGDWTVFRMFPSTGVLDPAFAPGGFLLVNPTPSFDSMCALEIRDGRLYLAGTEQPGVNGRWHVQRRSLATLQLDPTFGTGGILTVDRGPGVDALASIVFSGTSFYLTGTDTSLLKDGWRTERRSTSDGALLFAATSDPSPRQDIPTASIVADNALLVAGYDMDAANCQWRIERRSLETGALSLTFGTPGTLTVDPVPTQYDAVGAMAKDGASLFVAAVDYAAGPTDSRWRIEKRHATTGILDGTFGADGVVIVDPSAGLDAPSAMAVAGGWLFVGGIDYATGHVSWRIEKRSTSDGSLDPSFADGGVFTWESGGDYDQLRAMIVVGPHLLAAGESTPESSRPWDRQWELIKLACADGQPAWGVNGHVASNSSPNWDAPFALASDGVSLFVCGAGNSVGLDVRWRTEKRSLATGALDPAFGTGGWIEVNNGPSLEIPMALAVADGALFIAGSVENQVWRVEKRKATTGALVGGFGTGGVVQLAPEGLGAEVRGIAVDGTALYLAGIHGLGGRVEKRDTGKGKLAKDFGSGGVVAFPDATVTHLALEPGALFLGGFCSGNDLMFLHKMSR